MRYDDRAPRVFCLSMQRTGTTSVGRFFRDMGFQWAGWPADEKNGWSSSWNDGDYEAIFASEDFRAANAFEDSPWWSPGFYRVLFHRFPNARFVLFERDPDAWFRSMVSHSGGDVIGDTEGHCRVFRRELEYFELLTSGTFDREAENRVSGPKTMKLAGHEAHYKALYRLHGLDVRDFFARVRPEVLFATRLEEPDKWQTLGAFLNVRVPDGYDAHENPSPTA